MKYSEKEINAVLRVAIDIASAGGEIEEYDISIVEEFRRKLLGERVKNMEWSQTTQMDSTESLAILSNMEDTKKEVALGCYAAILGSDHESFHEEPIWREICTLVGYPYIPQKEALKFWTSLYVAFI